MKLLLFQFKLLVFLVLFILDLLLIQIKKAKLIFLTVFVILFLVNLIFFYLIKAKIDSELVQNNSDYSPTQPEEFIKSEKTESQIRTEILYWEKIIEKQPKSRDALINLSILKKILLEDEEAENLWNQAKNIDPNNRLFTK